MNTNSHESSPICRVCRAGRLTPLLDFGLQPLCNRYLASLEEEENRFSLALAYCPACGLSQLEDALPPGELKSRFPWITYNEQEAHLDALVSRIFDLHEGHLENATVGALSYKDDTTLKRFEQKGVSRTWRLSLHEHLGMEDEPWGLESIQQAMTPANADRIVQQVGQADILLCRHILEHAHDPRLFAESLGQLVKPEGLIVFEVPDCQHALESRDYSMPWEEHVAYYTTQTFSASLGKLGFELQDFVCYPYPSENSLVAIVRQSLGTADSREPHVSTEELNRALEYASTFPDYRSHIQRIAETHRENGGSIAVFGAGHASCFWINATGVSEHIDFLVDDHPKKKGMFMPGSRLPIKGSSALLEEGITLCLLSLSPESEQKVRANNREYTARGGRFASIYPGRENSIEKLAP